MCVVAAGKVAAHSGLGLLLPTPNGCFKPQWMYICSFSLYPLHFDALLALDNLAG